MADEKYSLIALLFADRATRAEGGKANLHGVFQALISEEYPAQHENMAVFFKFTVPRGTSSVPVRLKITRPNGAKEWIPQLNIPVADRFAEGILNIQGFLFYEKGDHVFSLYVEDNCIAKYIIEANIGTPIRSPEDDYIH
ncbi:MAG: hypothetical protein AAFV53_29665 [Myxococcota bacterium]